MATPPSVPAAPRWQGRAPRLARMVLAVVLLAAAVAPSGGATVRGAAASLPVGRWETVANGDDVLCLALQGEVLWAGTWAGGLVRWDTADGSYVQYLRPQDPLAANTVVDIAIDGLGRKWLATQEGLTMLDDRGTASRADDVWRTYTVANTSGGLPSDDVRSLAVDGDLVWVGGAQVWDPAAKAWLGGGVGRLDTAGTQATSDDTWMPVATYAGTIKEAPDGEKLGLVSDNVSDIVVTATRDLWVSTEPHWLYEKPPVAELEARWVRAHGGISYLATQGTEDPGDDVWTANDCEDFQVTVTCQVQDMALDASGMVWAAIAGRGVMYFPAATPQIIDERSRRFDLQGGAADDFVESIAFGAPDDPALSNTVWLGRRQGGLSVLDHQGTLRLRDDDRWDYDRGGPLTTKEGLPVDRVQSLLLTAGHAYLGMGSELGRPGGLARVRTSDQAVEGTWRTVNAPPTNFLTEIAFGQPDTRWAGHVWLGTGSRSERLFGMGAVDLDTRGTRDRADDTWTTFSAASTDDDGQTPWTGLAGDNVHAVVLDGDRVWLGSSESTWDQAKARYADGGLSLYDGQQWTARTLLDTGGPASGLGSGSVSALALGCQGELWVGSGNGWDFWGAGVDVLVPQVPNDRTMDRWTRYSYPKLASNNTTGIAVDCGSHRIWVASQHHVTQGGSGASGGDLVGGGVAVYDAQAGTWTRYGKAEGFESYSRSFIDGEATSIAVGPDGSVWAGGYGTRAMETSQLVSLAPFYPAVINTKAFGAGQWSSHVWDGAGEVAAVAVDADGRTWAATSRGGAARDSAHAESWRYDRFQGGLMVYDNGSWTTLDIANSGLLSNDLSAVAVAPEGDIWVASEGWGLARFMVGEPEPTPTATSDAPTPTASPTRRPTGTPTAPGSATPTASGTTTPRPGHRLFLPLAARPSRGAPKAVVYLPLASN